MGNQQAAILIIIFWKFTMLQYRQKLITSTTKLVYDLPNDLRILGNIGKIWNMGVISSIISSNNLKYPVFLPKIKLRRQQSKSLLKQILKLCSPVQFYTISLLCSKCFVRDCENFFSKINQQVKTIIRSLRVLKKKQTISFYFV